MAKPAFGKQDKMTLEEISEAGSFEAFRDRVIEEQLKKRYVKDLLWQLHAMGVELVDEKRGDKPVQLVELVLRRPARPQPGGGGRALLGGRPEDREAEVQPVRF
jgi:hypothetical protein